MVLVGWLYPLAIGALFYSILNIIIRLFITVPGYLLFKDQQDFIGQHVSLMHSIQAIGLCIASYIKSNGIDYMAPTEYLQVVTLSVSLGYFLYDALYAEIYGLHEWDMRFHHVFVIIGGISLLMQPFGGAIGPTCLFITEISNPYLEMRLILKNKKMENTRAYRIVEIAFAAVFIINR
jgi:TLC domain